MINTYDIAYGLGVGVSAPYWLLKPSSRRKVMAAFSQRMGDVPFREGNAPAVMIHAVSLGEINATRMLVARLRELKPDLHFVISTTTETGYARAMELYGGNGRPARVRRDDEQAVPHGDAARRGVGDVAALCAAQADRAGADDGA